MPRTSSTGQKRSFSMESSGRVQTAAEQRIERYHESVGRARISKVTWPGAAFIVEAMVLLVFLAGSVAVLMNLSVSAEQSGRESNDLMHAIVYASNAAEEFEADPTAPLTVEGVTVPGTGENDNRDATQSFEAINGFSTVDLDGLTLGRSVTVDATEGGVMYTAHISVSRDGDPSGDPVYTIEATRYVSSASPEAVDQELFQRAMAAVLQEDAEAAEAIAAAEDDGQGASSGDAADVNAAASEEEATTESEVS